MAKPYEVGNNPEHDRSWVLYRCRDVALLKDPTLDDIMVQTLKLAGIESYESCCHQFPPPGEGVTATVIIGASRADAHCWPEVGTMILGCFSCGDCDEQVYQFVDYMLQQAQPESAFEVPERKIHVRMPKIIPASWIPMRWQVPARAACA